MTLPKLSACMLGCGLLAVTTLAQPHPSFERGFDPAKMYQFDNVDTINLLNGNAIINIPIGPSYPVSERLSYRLTLVYNSKVWDHRQIGSCDQPIPVRQSNAGMGWRLSLGTLLSPTDAANVDDYGYWVYIGADGAVHRFYSKLHEDDSENDPSDYYQYTRDGSYIRMRYMSSVQRAIEFPDGLFQTFQLSTWPGGYNEWRIIGISDRFNDRGNGLPNVLIQYPTATTMQLSDQFGRTQTVTFTSDSAGWYARLVQSVTLKAFNGTTATYTLTYLQSQTVPVPAEPGICNNWLNVNAPLLSSVSQPDGTTWAMQAYTTVNGGNGQSGAISSLTLPTRGQIGYTYQLRLLPVTECSGRRWQAQSGAVATRTFYDAGGASLGAWTYSSVLSTSPTGWCDGQPYPKPQEELKVTVVTPLKDKAVHYFSVFPGWSFNGGYTGSFLPEEYGLPLSHFPVPDGGAPPRFLSSEQYDCNESTGACPSTPTRQMYSGYQRDGVISCGFDGANFGPDCLNSNRRVAADRTLFRDDPTSSCTGYPNTTCRTWTNDNSEFDGLGHYRTTTTGGNLGAVDVRTTTTHYNPGSGTYPGSFVPWPTANPWVINTYDYQQVTENSTNAKAEYCFDANTGYLNRKRTLKPGTTEGAADLIVAFTASTAGNTTSEQYFGGDTQTLTTGSLCSLTLPANQYRVDHTYQNGVRKTSRYYDGSGNPLSFYILDQDIDANTGFPSRSRDSAGIYTDFTYDGMNRVTWVKPQTSFNGGAWFQNVYTNAAGTNPARVNVYMFANGTTSGALGQEEYSFDPFGRLAKERQLLPSGSWNQHFRQYNALGLITSVSEWQPDGTSGSAIRQTSYQGYDPFGRPTTVTPPDGTTHNITYAYVGIRQLTRTVNVGTSKDASNNIIEAPSTTTEIYDRQGHLYQVMEPSKTDGTNATTTYGYDVGNRLKTVSMSDGTNTQARTFTYDNRGFLSSEQLPEKGATGNGTVTYSLYDARGHAGRVQDGPNDLTFSYDRAERLSQARETGGSQRILKSFTFATANGTTPDGGTDYCNGKLKTATRNNYYDGTNNVPILDTYYYGDKAGRTSHRVTGVLGTTITAKFTTQDWGDMATVQYPQISGVGSTRTATYTYTNGWLTGISGYATMSYWTNGMVNQITHANGVTVNHEKDPNDVARPGRIWSSGAASNWNSGTYQFDGAGNVVKIGSDYNLYDKVSRVVTGAPRAAAYTQSYTFDAFGNITQINTNGSVYTTATSASTNRLSSASYDAAGNVRGYQGFSYSYDPFNQQRQLTGTGLNQYYYYDANGERIGFRDVTPNVITLTARGLDGKPLREYSYNGSAWSWSRDYVWREGKALAVIDSVGTRHFANDHLGTARLITNSDTGKTVWGYHAYYPFGEEAATTWDAERIKFTGHERDLHGSTDTLDDLDYMHARYYKPVSAERFFSVDPIGGDAHRPQSWNRYAYAMNNPLRLVDPTGMMINEYSTGTYVDQSSGILGPPPGSKQAAQAQSGQAVANATAQTGTPAPAGGAGQAQRTPVQETGPRDVTPEEGQRILTQGETYLGDPYQIGGFTHNGIDCSNLVANAINEAGIPYTYSTTAEMATNPGLRPINPSEARAGDIALFTGHTGIFNPNPPQAGRTLLSAQSKAGQVMYGKISWFGTPTFYRVQVPALP